MGILLAPVAMIYNLVNRIRRRFYETGFFRAQRLSKPVISVGNLTVGGTGKTPFVEVLLTQLEARGLKCCVLTRGYGRKSSQTLLASSSTTPDDAGDEPLWLFNKHPNAKIAVGADRVAAAKLAPDVDVYILDDGLQHLQIHRDFEITLIDATRPLSHYHSIPWGLAREGFNILKQSDLVVLTRSNQATSEQLDAIADVIFKNGVFDLIESSLELAGTSQNVGTSKVMLVSAIGNPESFETLAKSSGWNVVHHEKRADHTVYSDSDIASLEKKATSKGAEMIVVTEKDAVKLQKVLKSQSSLPWVVASTKMTFDPELPNIYDLVSHSSH